jgi:hypothetical protein
LLAKIEQLEKRFPNYEDQKLKMKEENKLLNTDIMVLNKKIENLKKLEDANLKLV